MDAEFEIVLHGGELYRDAVRLHEAVLRAPLGLVFTPEELAAERGHIQIIGLESGRVRACAVLVPGGEQMKMQRVAVDPDLQGRGVGSAMMKFCEDYAARSGARTVYVHARDSAVAFYERNGYVGEGDYFDEDGVPHLKMWKTLSSS